MAAKTHDLCQSGVKVLISGTYRLVDVPFQNAPGTSVILYRGEKFPVYDGREACWYLIGLAADRRVTAPLRAADWDEPESQVEAV